MPTVVLTSATLSSGGNFHFIRERLGLDEGEEMVAESIFDFENQAVSVSAAVDARSAFAAMGARGG